MRLEKFCVLSKMLAKRGMTLPSLSRAAHLSAKRIRQIMRGAEMSGSEARNLAKALKTRVKTLTVSVCGCLYVRERRFDSFRSVRF